MQIEVFDAKKLVSIWLTSEESRDEALKARLKPLYAEYKRKKFMVAVFHSGQEDLPSLTAALLKHNRWAQAEQEARTERQMTKERQELVQPLQHRIVVEAETRLRAACWRQQTDPVVVLQRPDGNAGQFTDLMHGHHVFLPLALNDKL